ncbi:MAG TPA: DNA polymerase ligase N-terminal domain-containing protein [Patescibacteria group bacterium]|jgi:bifunctional non-homologous end joining protein LigD|nr:DNA polymerase ligase N-terminal domain-containing protein [Patescibacteria group bacterium]
MTLAKYKQKRKFNQTPEPGGITVRHSKALIFVIQKHQARQLHYDFRLEADGVLKSWAIPKGPSMNTADKRLAMMVEDHPYEYRKFAGVIPPGNYGAGTVTIWDHGNYSALGANKVSDSEKLIKKGLKDGQIKFVLNGKKLKGGFALIKIKNRFGGGPRRNKRDNTWLLIKERDAYAKQ